MDPPRENNSPSTPSRYLNSYLQQNSTEIFHQNFSQRQLPNQQFYAADNLSTNNKNYLKRHHPSYHNDKTESEREKKYDKYENKKLDEAGSLTHGSFEGFNSDAYAATNIAPPAVAAVTPTPAVPQKAVAKSLSNGKKTKGRVKIKMEYIDNKLRRYTTFSKRKTGIMKKAYELSTLTGTQVMLLVASETGHVYTFATRKLQPMITSEAGKTLIQTCLNSPDIPPNAPTSDQRMSATGFEETELNYSISDLGENPGDKEKVRQLIFNSHQNLPQNTSHLYNLPHAQHFSHSPQSSQHFSHFSPPQHHFPSPHFPQQSFYENQNLQTASPQNYHSLAATAASVAGQSQSH